MKKRLFTLSLAAVLMASTFTACDEASGQPAQTSASFAPSTTSAATTTTRDEDEYAATDAEIRDLNTDNFVPDGNSGKIVWLGYYDLEGDGIYAIFTSEQYGGEIEYISCSSGSGYYERLGTLIASGDSPDLVRYDWPTFPYAISKNMYEPLDEYIDLESPLWEGIASTVDNFSYGGKHYYYPHRITVHFALNYNKRVIAENNLPDPYQLYKDGNWTWDTFRELLIEWCNLDENNVGITGEGGMSFIATTGTTLIDVQPDGTIVNNLNNPNVTRAMQFCADLYRDGLTYQNELGGWVSPQLWAKNSEQLLFLGMNPEWTYGAAAGEIQNPSGVENDICGVATDFAFVPYPRDPKADAYYAPHDTFGYLVPKGAKNIKGATDWINLNRVYETDPERVASAREESINPVPVYYTAGKYEGRQKWQLVWDEREYDMWQEMLDPEKFTLVFDDCNGFGDEMKKITDSILFDPMYQGSSWAQLSAENENAINAIIESYNE